MTKSALMRWNVTVWYRTDNGSIDVMHAIEELENLHDLIERGPDWNAVERIEIKLARKSEPKLTLEASRMR